MRCPFLILVSRDQDEIPVLGLLQSQAVLKQQRVISKIPPGVYCRVPIVVTRKRNRHDLSAFASISASLGNCQRAATLVLSSGPRPANDDVRPSRSRRSATYPRCPAPEECPTIIPDDADPNCVPADQRFRHVEHNTNSTPLAAKDCNSCKQVSRPRTVGQHPCKSTSAKAADRSLKQRQKFLGQVDLEFGIGGSPQPIDVNNTTVLFAHLDSHLCMIA